jgi:hypothetical protein
MGLAVEVVQDGEDRVTDAHPPLDLSADARLRLDSSQSRGPSATRALRASREKSGTLLDMRTA